jgi:hypothetical protein
MCLQASILSKSAGTFSTKYSTIASGPLSTCSPCGIACVLIPGTSFSAMLRISAACSAVHIEAEKSTLGCFSRTVGATSSIATIQVSYEGVEQKMGKNTGAVCNMFDFIAIL